MDLFQATAYLAIRAEHPSARAADVWAYVQSDEHWMTFEQYTCRHQWSHGYDDSDHEIPIHCNLCGVSGDI